MGTTMYLGIFFFSSRRRHTRSLRDWSSDVCSSDLLLLAKDLLHESGSCFVQISDENVHHVRELMDEVFGPRNAVGLITFKKTTSAGSPSGGPTLLASVSDYLVWYGKDKALTKYNQLYFERT